MNIISRLRNKQKSLIITGSLLLGLALTPIASNAANVEHERYRDNDIHNTNRHQGNRHTEINIRHNHHHNKHAYADRHFYVPQGHHRAHHHKRRNLHHKKRYHKSHYHRKPHYVVNHHHHYHSDPYDLQIGMHTGNFNIIVRD